MRGGKSIAGTAAALVVGALIAVSGALVAEARVPPNDPLPGGTPQGLLTDVRFTSTILRSTVFGSTGAVTTPMPAYPAPGASAEGNVPAALLVLTDAVTGQSGLAYCIDFHTGTDYTYGYNPGVWSEANVPNNAAINFILTNYYPFNPLQPTGLSTLDQVAAVQSAIWYLSDGFVLATTVSPAIVAATTAIVNAARLASVPEPVEPILTVTPATLQAPASGELTGPFVVGGNVTGSLLESTPGTQLFFDQAGTQPISVGTAIPPGSQVWVSFVGGGLTTGFTIAGQTTVSVGTVYLYDGLVPGVAAGQKLILAQNGTLPVRAGATVTAYDPADLQLTKTIDWIGTAGAQGAITISASCAPAPAMGIPTSITVPAGTAPGSYVFTLTGLVSTSVCTVTETVDGVVPGVVLRSTTITPASVTLDPQLTTTAEVTNTYQEELAATGSSPPLGVPLVLLTLGVAVLVVTSAARHRHLG